MFVSLILPSIVMALEINKHSLLLQCSSTHLCAFLVFSCATELSLWCQPVIFNLVSWTLCTLGTMLYYLKGSSAFVLCFFGIVGRAGG